MVFFIAFVGESDTEMKAGNISARIPGNIFHSYPYMSKVFVGSIYLIKRKESCNMLT